MVFFIEEPLLAGVDELLIKRSNIDSFRRRPS